MFMWRTIHTVSAAINSVSRSPEVLENMRNMMNVTGILLVLALISAGYAAVSAEEMRTFIDDVGREIILPVEVEIDAVS